MEQNYLPLDKSPLVNIRRAIKRSHLKRQANLFNQSHSIQSFLKSQPHKYCRYSLQQKNTSPKLKIRFSYNQSTVKQISQQLQRREDYVIEYQEQNISQIHKKSKQFRVKRHSQIRCRSDLFIMNRQNYQTELQNNLTISNLIPRHTLSQKRALKKINSIVNNQQNVFVEQSNTKESLKLKFNIPLIYQNKYKSKEKRRLSRSIAQFCPWKDTNQGQQNYEDQFFAQY